MWQQSSVRNASQLRRFFSRSTLKVNSFSFFHKVKWENEIWFTNYHFPSSPSCPIHCSLMTDNNNAFKEVYQCQTDVKMTNGRLSLRCCRVFLRSLHLFRVNFLRFAEKERSQPCFSPFPNRWLVAYPIYDSPAFGSDPRSTSSINCLDIVFLPWPSSSNLDFTILTRKDTLIYQITSLPCCQEKPKSPKRLFITMRQHKKKDECETERESFLEIQTLKRWNRLATLAPAGTRRFKFLR